MNLKQIATFSVIAIAMLACKEKPSRVVKTEPVTFKKEGQLEIYKQKVDTLITTFEIEIAESDYETQTGLMYRKEMANYRGMLFIFPDVRMHAFYMKNTEIPLDLIFIGNDLKIASFQENAKPYSEVPLSSQVPIQYVLEINAGLAEKFKLEIGDQIVFTRVAKEE